MKRFSLTKSCLVAAAPCVLAASASGDVATFNIQLDAYASEARWYILGSAGSSIADWVGSNSWLSGSSLLLNTPEFVSDATGPGQTISISLELAPGTYTMVLLDAYGDGWNYDGVENAGMGFADDAVGDFIAFEGGTFAFGSFVVPAPASLALLGLAGLTRRKRA